MIDKMNTTTYNPERSKPMSQLADYWKLGHEAQEEIKAAHPTTPLYKWRVQGRFNINYKPDTGGLSGDGFAVDQTVLAHTALDAAGKVAQGWVGQYNNVTSYGWLNGDPTVTQIIKEIFSP